MSVRGLHRLLTLLIVTDGKRKKKNWFRPEMTMVKMRPEQVTMSGPLIIMMGRILTNNP